jgi:hypothetical protein
MKKMILAFLLSFTFCLVCRGGDQTNTEKPIVVWNCVKADRGSFLGGTFKIHRLGAFAGLFGCKSNDYFAIRNDRFIFLRSATHDNKILMIQSLPINKVCVVSQEVREPFCTFVWNMGESWNTDLQDLENYISNVTIYMDEKMWSLPQPILEKPDQP